MKNSRTLNGSHTFSTSDGRDEAHVRSPALRGVIRRNFVESDREVIERAFQLALRSGGESEIGFDREEGVSYNPRPARVAQILVGDGGVLNPEAVAAATLAASDVSEASVRSAGLPEGVVNMLGAVRRRDSTSSESVGIRLAMMLDFARHLHLLPKGRDVLPELEEFWSAWSSVIESGREPFPRLAQLLENWRLRHERRNINRQ